MEIRQKTYTKIDISHRIKKGCPRKAAVEHLTDRLILFLLEDCIRNVLLVSVDCQIIYISDTDTSIWSEHLVPATLEAAEHTLCSYP